MLTSESIAKIMPALIKAQSDFAPAVKAKVNPHFKSKYVPLDAVIDAIAEPLRNNGIAIVQQTDVVDAQTILVTRLIHESGEWLAGRYPVHPIKADPQGEGSALTYARRYALMAIAGIAPEDDDGNAAVKATQREQGRRDTSNEGRPTSGAWEAMDADQQAGLTKLALQVADTMEADGADAAHALIERQKLDAEEKIALWTQLPSQIRTALKKAHKAAEHKEAA